jgi:hypothetical protein
MSCRGTVIFMGTKYGGSTDVVRLYQHCDAYPSRTLGFIKDSLKAARRKAKKGFNNYLTTKSRPEFYFREADVSASLMAGSYIGETTDSWGMSVELEYDRPLRYVEPPQGMTYRARLSDMTVPELEEIFGNHGDLEWVYVVNSITASVQVYGGGYQNTDPLTIVYQGTVDPFLEIEGLKEEYEVRTRQAIRSKIRMLDNLGYGVNPKTLLPIPNRRKEETQ